ncbi:MAG: TlpA disulfide reductase family protein [Candidatus Omnitrophica bacterium]|nr:TlpA disulfide reductase family protein [Candidatus Omnitrophota bacterium]
MSNTLKICMVIWVTFLLIAPLSGFSAGTRPETFVQESPVCSGFEQSFDFQLQDLNNVTYMLSSYRGKRPVILLFWTTWCPMCREGIKKLNEMYPQLVKDNFEVLSINVREQESKVSRFVKANSLAFKILLDKTGNTAKDYGLVGIPTYIIIDKEGCIRFRDHFLPQEELKAMVVK